MNRDALEELKRAIDAAAAPENMSQEEALDLYEELETHCSISADALREEMDS